MTVKLIALSPTALVATARWLLSEDFFYQSLDCYAIVLSIVHRKKSLPTVELLVDLHEHTLHELAGHAH